MLNILCTMQVDFMLGSDLCLRKSTSIAVLFVSYPVLVFPILETINYSPFLGNVTSRTCGSVFDFCNERTKYLDLLFLI